MFWLTRYIGSGTEADPFRPLGADELGQWSAIDLRPDSTVTAGFALLQGAGPLAVQAGRVSLGDDADANSAAVKSAIESRLGVTLADSNLRRIVRSLLVQFSRTDGTRWKPLQPEGPRYRIWFGGLFDDFPRVAGGAVAFASESFNKADSATLGPDLAWTEVTGNIDVVSNAAKVNTSGGFSNARAEIDMATPNHYAQGNGITVPTDSVHIYVRFDSTAPNAYLALLNSAGQAAIFKDIAQSYTALSSVISGLGTTGVSLRCSASGSTLRFAHNGVQQGTVTDTTIAGNTRGGIGGFNNTASIDSFEIGSVNALPFQSPRPRRVLMRSAR